MSYVVLMYYISTSCNVPYLDSSFRNSALEGIERVEGGNLSQGGFTELRSPSSSLDSFRFESPVTLHFDREICARRPSRSFSLTACTYTFRRDDTPRPGLGWSMCPVRTWEVPFTVHFSRLKIRNLSFPFLFSWRINVVIDLAISFSWYT